ncbi:MAG: hypothetical protein R3D25_10125 [Geminicoccaceae bacterium]
MRQLAMTLYAALEPSKIDRPPVGLSRWDAALDQIAGAVPNLAEARPPERSCHSDLRALDGDGLIFGATKIAVLEQAILDQGVAFDEGAGVGDPTVMVSVALAPPRATSWNQQPLTYPLMPILPRRHRHRLLHEGDLPAIARHLAVPGVEFRGLHTCPHAAGKLPLHTQRMIQKSSPVSSLKPVLPQTKPHSRTWLPLTSPRLVSLALPALFLARKTIGSLLVPERVRWPRL